MESEKPAPSDHAFLSPAVRQVFWAFLVSRTLILIILILASDISFFEIPAIEGHNLNPTISLEPARIRPNLARVLGSADAGWYLRIARDGYDPAPFTDEVAKNWVFFPLYPLLVRFVSAITGSAKLAGILISNAAFFASMLLLLRFARQVGVSEAATIRASWILAFFPMSYFFSGPFTESIFLLLSLGAFVALNDSRLILSAALMAFATATRPTGLLLLPAFACAMRPHLRGARPRAILSLCIAPLGAIAFCGYLYHLLGEPLAFAHNQRAWGRGKQSFGSLCYELVSQPLNMMEPWSFTALHLLSLVAGAFTIYLFVRLRRIELALFVFVPLATALSTGELLSVTRFTMALFPVPLALAVFASTPEKERTVLALFASTLGIMTALYAYHVTAAMT